MRELIAIRAKNYNYYCQKCFEKLGLEKWYEIFMIQEASRYHQAILCNNTHRIDVDSIMCFSCRKSLFDPESETLQTYLRLMRKGVYSSDGRLKSLGEINRRTMA